MAKGNSKLSGGAGVPNDATEYYVSGDGMYINNMLRRGNALDDFEKKLVSDLDKATNGKIKDDTLYRSVDASAIFGNMSDTDYDNLRVSVIYGENAIGNGAYADKLKANVRNKIQNATGKTITEKGYMSTTTSQSVAEEWGGFSGSDKPVVMKIKTGANTKGVDLSRYDKKVSKEEAQHERLLARNQKYKVKKIYGHNNQVYVDVEMN